MYDLSKLKMEHVPNVEEIIKHITKKAVARVRRREVTPLLKAIELAITYIEDGAAITAKDRLETAIRNLKREQKGA